MLNSWLFLWRNVFLDFLEYHLFYTFNVIVINIYIYRSQSRICSLIVSLSVSHSRTNKFKTTILSQIFFSSGEDSSTYVCVGVCMFKESHSRLHDQSLIVVTTVSVLLLKGNFFEKITLSKTFHIKKKLWCFLFRSVCVYVRVCLS